MRIQLHIDSLRLTGVAPTARATMAALIEERLNGLVQELGPPPGLAGGGGLFLPSRVIHLAPGRSPQQAAAEVARRIAVDLYGPLAAGARAPLAPAAPLAPLAPTPPARSARREQAALGSEPTNEPMGPLAP